MIASSLASRCVGINEAGLLSLGFRLPYLCVCVPTTAGRAAPATAQLIPEAAR